MGFWAELRDWAGLGSGETKMTSAELDAIMRGGGRMSGSGAVVNWQTALQVTTMLACCRVLADGVAQVPFKVYSKGAGRIEAVDHPLYDLIHRRPNPWQTSFEFRETIMFHLVSTNNALIRKLRVGSERRLASLEPMEPGRAEVRRERDGRLRYWYTPESGSRDEIPAAEIWHIRGPSWNSWIGMDATKLLREALGLAISTEAAHADFHRNGARKSGLYSVDGNLDQAKYDQISKWLDQHVQGGERAGKPMILDRAAKFTDSQMSGVDAQHLETRRFQVEEICRGVRLMPIMVGVPGAAGAYDNGEQMFIAHVVHSLMPWYERIEQSADVNLLSIEDRLLGYYTKFNPNGLMRGAAKDRGEYFAKALGAGGSKPWMTQDDVRGFEELSPIGGHAAELGTGAMDAKPPQGTQGA